MTEINFFEKDDIAKSWIEMLKLDHSNPDKSVRMTAVYPYILDWLEKNKITEVVDVGSGDGYLASIIPECVNYTGIEPSKYLVESARRQHIGANIKHENGSAYGTNLVDGNCEGAVSVMVWFHLLDLDKAAKELYRNLKQNGKFLIITSNSLARETWKGFYQKLSILF